jgi:flagellar protein FlbD
VIRVTRLNNTPFLINSDLIKFVEQAPDTLITLVNGEKIIVQESVDDIVDRIILFRRSVIEGCGSTGSDPNLIASALTRQRHEDGGRNAEGAGRG